MNNKNKIHILIKEVAHSPVNMFVAAVCLIFAGSIVVTASVVKLTQSDPQAAFFAFEPSQSSAANSWSATFEAENSTLAAGAVQCPNGATAACSNPRQSGVSAIRPSFSGSGYVTSNFANNAYVSKNVTMPGTDQQSFYIWGKVLTRTYAALSKIYPYQEDSLQVQVYENNASGQTLIVNTTWDVNEAGGKFAHGSANLHNQWVWSAMGMRRAEAGTASCDLPSTTILCVQQRALSLTGGKTYEFRFYIREANTRLDTFYITNDISLIPQDGGTYQGVIPGTIKIQAVSVSHSLPSGAINTNIAKFTLQASNEDIRVISLAVTPVLSGMVPSANGIRNVGLHLDGVRIGLIQNWNGSGSLHYNLEPSGIPFILQKDKLYELTVSADLVSTTGVPYNAGSVYVSLPNTGVTNGEGVTTKQVTFVPLATTNSIINSIQRSASVTVTVPQQSGGAKYYLGANGQAVVPYQFTITGQRPTQVTISRIPYGGGVTLSPVAVFLTDMNCPQVASQVGVYACNGTFTQASQGVYVFDVFDSSNPGVKARSGQYSVLPTPTTITFSRPTTGDVYYVPQASPYRASIPYTFKVTNSLPSQLKFRFFSSAISSLQAYTISSSNICRSLNTTPASFECKSESGFQVGTTGAYKIEVKSADDNTVVAVSPSFTISLQPLALSTTISNVVAPVTGQSVAVNQTQAVIIPLTFTVSGTLPANMMFKLFKDGSLVPGKWYQRPAGEYCPASSSSQGVHSCSGPIGFEAVAAGSYQVEVSDPLYSSVRALSPVFQVPAYQATSTITNVIVPATAQIVYSLQAVVAPVSFSITGVIPPNLTFALIKDGTPVSGKVYSHTSGQSCPLSGLSNGMYSCSELAGFTNLLAGTYQIEINSTSNPAIKARSGSFQVPN
ncbi:MAG TPA: hypothetical protein VEA59_07090 [Patescibacteria group bacterium]|nr:hypothetical protein [Patescibacteria group bacterium]